jgi:HPt (histidine-containing phosphotransfer) domain-containing protein
MTADLERLAAAVADRRPSEFAAAAHSIRGSAQMIGSRDLSEAAAAAERAAGAAGSETRLVGVAAATLRRRAAATLEALQGHLAGHEPLGAS